MGLQMTRLSRPSLVNAMRSASVSVELEQALSVMHDALGEHDARIADMIFADAAGDRWKHLTVKQRIVMLTDYAATQVQHLGRRLS